VVKDWNLQEEYFPIYSQNYKDLKGYRPNNISWGPLIHKN